MKRSRTKALWAIVALLALNAVLLAAQPGLAFSNGLPNNVAAYLFGPKLVRAEVVLKDGQGLRDYRIDRGVIRATSADSITLRERDNSFVKIAVAADAEITFRGRTVDLLRLRRGMLATVIRDGDAPAIEIRAGR